MLELNKIYNMNCLEGIKEMPDRSINLICTDPPYCLGLTHNGQKGTYTDLNIAEPFYKQLAAEFRRVLTADGCLYMFTDWRTYSFYYPIINSVLEVKNMLVWDKLSGRGNYYSNEHELIIFHTGNKQFRCRGARNVIRGISSFSTGAKKTDGGKVHPTQKPVSLIRKIIEDSTKENDVVLDCFMGSGTTALACMEAGRNFIGFEISEEYCRIADSRINRYKLAYTE